MNNPMRTGVGGIDLSRPQSESRLAELRLFTLQLINKDRIDHGLSPVALGSNPAAQSHAEDMLVQWLSRPLVGRRSKALHGVL